MNEIWKPIENFNNYEISNLGNVRNITTGKALKGFDDGWGYLQVRLYKAGKGYTKFIHRLVAENFIPNPENYLCVNHRDEDKVNNAVSNLEWCSHEYNNNYGTRNERIGEAMLGEKNHKAKKVKCIETNEIFNSTADAARKYGLERCAVSNAANPNNTYHKKAAGFTWCYI